MSDLPICPPCHGECNQGRNCNALDPMATMMLEVNRLSIELEKANKAPRKLSDEEIDSIWTEMSEQCDEEFIDMKQFARAILKKASEK